jgi:hypothetical protein
MSTPAINARWQWLIFGVESAEPGRGLALLWHICRDQPGLVWLGLFGLLATRPGYQKTAICRLACPSVAFPLSNGREGATKEFVAHLIFV